MKPNCVHIATAIFLAYSTSCYALAPPLPPATSGSGDAGMKHALVSLTGTNLSIHVQSPPASPVTMFSEYGTDFTPDKFNVLEDVYFNAQHGWLPDGFISLPSDRFVWIERTAATQPSGAAFKVFEGGNGMEGTAHWTMDEIYVNDGDIWQWDGVMQHDYFTADMLGNYSMSFEVYVGDQSGSHDARYGSASTTFYFTVVPEPRSLVMTLMGAVALFVARRL